MAESQALTLMVARSEPAADGIRLFELRDPDGAELPGFTPGAHLGLRVPNGSMRSYSLCNDPAERDRYVIAVKRDAAGRGGSVSLVDGVKQGDRVEATAPRNLFELAPGAPGYIFVAGGIGITPIRSMIHWLRRGGETPYHLYYLTRTASGTAFHEEFSQADHQPRVVMHHDEGDPDQAYDLWPVFEQPTRAHIYCCGPRPLMDAVRDMTGHWPASQVHFEDFGSDLSRPRPGDTPFTVRLARSDAVLEVPVGETILSRMRAHGLTVASSCESGTCGTCRTKLISGDVDHRDLLLTPSQQKRLLMVCVSRAVSGELVIDA